ncbi:MAG: hypothetical protein F6K14_16510 [Symploca sp. SIO2C1]|nr:hypothetical protein [Symploca sp. SIO2C1]
MVATKKGQLVICLRNEGCEDLTRFKVYQVLPDSSAARDNYIRVVDDCGEDYLYPEDYFLPVEFPQGIEEVLLASLSQL